MARAWIDLDDLVWSGGEPQGRCARDPSVDAGLLTNRIQSQHNETRFLVCFHLFHSVRGILFSVLEKWKTKPVARMAKVCTAAVEAKYLRASDEREMFTNKVEAQALGMDGHGNGGPAGQEPGNRGRTCNPGNQHRLQKPLPELETPRHSVNARLSTSSAQLDNI